MTGVKWQKIATANSVTEKTAYNGSFIYESEVGSMVLDNILTPEGMIETQANYLLKDDNLHQVWYKAGHKYVSSA